MTRFVAVSGLPASGKTTLGRALASALALPFIDKDAILEALFEREGMGDTAWRQRLSQAADAAFAQQAEASGGAVLASWWRHPLSNLATGTPTDWLRRLPAGLVEVHCQCSAVSAADRFMARVRHPGHLDGRWSRGDLLARFEQQAAFGALGVAPVVRVDTDGPPAGGVAEQAVRTLGASAFVTSVSANPAHGFSKPRHASIELLQGLGVTGDAHCGVTVKHRSRVAQDPTQPNLRQVHLIHAELFDELASAGSSVQPGDIGENITTRGIALLDLSTGALLQIGGTAVVEVTGLRTPCVQLDRFQRGLMAAVLGRAADGSVVRKAGVMAVVVAAGVVRPGDAVAVTLPAGPHRRLERV